MADLLRQEEDVFERGEGIQLALTPVAGAEPIWQLDDAQRPRRRSENGDQDLGTDAGEPRRDLVQQLAPQHEEAADRVGDLGFNQATCQPGAEQRQLLASIRQPFRAAAPDVSAGNHDIGRVLLPRVLLQRVAHAR